MRNYEETECDGYGEHLDLECYIAQYLVFNKSGTEGGVIHVWDIMNAKKVGAFALLVEGVSVSVEFHKEDEWLLRQVMQHSNDPHYFCLIFKTKPYPKQVLRTSHFRIKRFYTSLSHPYFNKS